MNDDTPAAPEAPANPAVAALAAADEKRSRELAIQGGFIDLQLQLTDHVVELMTTPGKQQEAAEFLASAWRSVAHHLRKLAMANPGMPQTEVLAAARLLSDYFRFAGDMRRAAADLRADQARNKRGEIVGA